jgi:hypothetical protein
MEKDEKLLMIDYAFFHINDTMIYKLRFLIVL